MAILGISSGGATASPGGVVREKGRGCQLGVGSWELGVGSCQLSVGSWELGVGSCQLGVVS